MIVFDGRQKVLKGNLHLHTTASDGRKTPEEAMALYRAAGYDFLAITDHNKVSTPTAMHDGLLVIQSIEFDFNLVHQVMHIVGIHVPEEIAAAVPRGTAPQKAIDTINDMGGIAILAHPAWSLNTPESMCSLNGVTAAEVYNTVSGRPWNADRADSTCVLDLCAANGHAFRMVASDDAHFYNGDACQSWTMVAAKENSTESILTALKNGDFYASRGPEFRLIQFDGQTFTVDCSPVRSVWFSSDIPYDGRRVVTGENLTHAEYTLRPSIMPRYVRITIEDENGKCAWSNPIVL